MRVCPICGTRTDARICTRDRVLTLDEQTDDPLIGRTFADRYQILAEVGAGNMGTVYLARQLVLDREVALKVLPEQRRKLEPIQRFYREMRVCARLFHPHCIHVYDFGHTEDGHLFLVMELLRGETLEAVLRREGPLLLPRTMHVAMQIVKGLGAAHSLGIVHRDVKPANVMLTAVFGETDHVRILDFGIARVVESGIGDTISLSGAFVGTPLYTSPEQARGDRPGPRSDLYSLGVVLFRMVSGQLPFSSQNAAALLNHHERTPAPRLTEVTAGGVPADLDALVGELLDKDPERRPRNAEEVLRRLRAILASSAAAGPAGVAQPAGPVLELPEEGMGTLRLSAGRAAQTLRSDPRNEGQAQGEQAATGSPDRPEDR